MATILDKEITRESIIKYDNREIQVTLTPDQKISMKLKGMKSGVVNIGIEELYKQLIGDTGEKQGKDEPTIGNKNSGSIIITEKVEKKEKNYNNSPMINLFDLRAMNMVTVMDIKTKVLFESIIVDTINRTKAIQKA